MQHSNKKDSLVRWLIEWFQCNNSHQLRKSLLKPLLKFPPARFLLPILLQSNEKIWNILGILFFASCLMWPNVFSGGNLGLGWIKWICITVPCSHIRQCCPNSRSHRRSVETSGRSPRYHNWMPRFRKALVGCWCCRFICVSLHHKKVLNPILPFIGSCEEHCLGG